MRKVAVALAVTLLVAVLPMTSRAAAADPSFATVSSIGGGEIRAFWVDAFGPGMYTAAEIDQLVADVKSAKMNAIVAQVVRRGDCWCDRVPAAPRTETPGVAAAPFDPLAYLVNRAHANGIQVHAWMIATAIWRGDTPPADPDHPFNLHGTSATGTANWLTRRSDGATRIPGNEDWMIDPGHPDAAQWIVDVATQLVANYAIDGINLDRIRYPDGNLGTNVPSWGYNPVAVARFQQATGRTDVPSNTDAQWVQWRRDQITQVVRKIYVESYAIRPSVRVSADTITYGSGPSSVAGFQGTRTFAEVLQDWVGWMREGILDLNIPMNYKRQADANQSLWYRQWSDFAKDTAYSRQVAIGPALYLNSVSDSVSQAQIARADSAGGAPSAGWVGYSYRTPDDLANAGQRSSADSRAALIAALAPQFTTPSAVPAMSWKTQPVTGHVHGTTTAGARVDLTTNSGTVLRTQTADGKGWFGFVDVAPGTYRIASNGVAMGSATVVAGQVAGVTVENGPCTSSVGPGIPPPGIVPSGIPGFHATWYGQSGYMTLCPGDTATAVVAYYNTGTRGWVLGKMGEVAYLGTWAPEPGQDMPSPLGGDGTAGSPDTGWPRYNRIAIQPHEWVGPNQVAWFQFTVKAPPTPGSYRLYLRPLIEGATWMEDYGVYWLVTVK